MKRTFLLIVLIATLCFTAASAQSGLRKKQFNTTDGVALSGYDPVAYFTTNKATEGKKEIAFTTDGITYHFATAHNRDLFKASPAQYEPQYGGWCAYAMGTKGEKVTIDPETFKIKDGKLYLFYNRLFNNTLPSWNKDEARLKTNADAAWQKLFR